MEDMSILHNESPSPMYSSDFEIKCPLSKSNAVSGSCDHNGGVLTSRNGDISITVPAGAIKDRDFVQFYIATDLYGPYALPSQHQNNLVSPFYWIGVTGSYCFHKPVQVEFEHYGACDPSHYQLLCCEDDDESYTMRPVGNCNVRFTVQDDTSLCTFQANHLCSYCLFCHRDQIPINRIGAFYLKPENFHNLNHFRVEIWFSFPIKLCLKRNKELHKSRSLVLDACFMFKASCDETSASYFAIEYSETLISWTIKHSLQTEINTEMVNFYNHFKKMEDLKANEECQLFPPRFILDVVKDPECTTNLNTNITVKLYNTEDTIITPCQFNLIVSIPTLKKSFLNNQKETSKCTSSLAVPDHCCSKSEPLLKDLVLFSSKISDHWEDIALQLKIPIEKIKEIVADNPKVNDRCRTMFHIWQQRASSPLCWCHFIKALYRLELNEIAHKAQEYLQLSPPNIDAQ